MKGKIFTVAEFPLVWECASCDNPFDEDDEDLIFPHPDYNDMYLCEDCCGNPSDNEGSTLDWMIDETEEEFFDHED